MMNQHLVEPQFSPPPRIGEWFSESFTLFGREWQAWMGQGAIYIALTGVPILIGYALMLGMAIGSAATSHSGSGSPNVPLLIGGVALFFLSLLATLYLAIRLLIGMKLTAVRQLRGEPIRARDIFEGGDRFWPTLGVTLLSALAHMVGLLLCIVGTYLAAGLFMLAPAAVVEERIGSLDALRRSASVTRPHLVLYALWYFLLSLLMSVGGSVCLVGLAATLPIYVLGVMITYRDTIGIPGALAPLTPTQDQVASMGYPQASGPAYPPSGAPFTPLGAPAPPRTPESQPLHGDSMPPSEPPNG